MSDWSNESMNLDEFCEYVAMNIKDYLPKSYQDWRPRITETINAIEPKKGIAILAPGENVAPVIIMNEFYNSYKDGRELPQLMNEISELEVKYAGQQREIPIFNRDNFPELQKLLVNWDYAKENVVLATAGCTKNAEMLARSPHCKMGDIAAVYRIEVGRGDDCSYSALVTHGMKAQYGVTTEELHAQALKNSMMRYPAQLMDFGDMVQTKLGISIPDMPDNPMPDTGIGSSGMMVLSNQDMIRGASVMFYPGVLDQVAALCPNGFYIIPSSVHELLILPKNGDFTEREIDEIIEFVNAEAVQPKEQLSDFVHEYDPVSKILYAPTLAQNYKLLEVSKDDVLKPETLGLTDDICNSTRSAAGGDGLSQAVKTEQQRRMMKKRAGR